MELVKISDGFRPQNAKLRSNYAKPCTWYDFANNEEDEDCIILAIRITMLQ